MRKFHLNPTRAQTLITARKIVRQHPASFEDVTDDGERPGTGYHSLLEQLKTGISHLNHDSTIARLRRPRRTVNADGAVAVQAADKYGCIAWQPEHLPNGETEDNLEVKRLELVELHHREGPRRSHHDRLDNLVQLTYCIQRQCINVKPPPSVEEVKEKWPYLFYRRWMYPNFKLLTGIPVAFKLKDALEKKGDRILRYMEAWPVS